MIGSLLWVALAQLLVVSAQAQSKHLAPGFSALTGNATVCVVAPDVELFSISGGGVSEPKADWTESAQKHLRSALTKRMQGQKLSTRLLTEDESEAFSEIGNLHAAVARSIDMHHMRASMLALPTKNGQLDWSLGDAVKPMHEKLGADYALFMWIRDYYASSERKAAMIALALFGVGIQGGIQTGYASLVDLRTGQVMWFNSLFRASGDLREEAPTDETIGALLKDFPVAK
jgi:hypothetical protein